MRLSKSRSKYITIFWTSSLPFLILQFIFKHRSLFIDLPFGDDITFFYNGLHGIDTYSRFDIVFFNYMVMATGSMELIRIIYTLLFAIAVGLWAAVIFMVSESILFALAITIAAFLSPYSYLMDIFVTASYNVIMVLSLAAAILFANGAVLMVRRPPVCMTIFVLLSSISILIGTATTTNAVLIPPLVLIPLGWKLFTALPKRQGYAVACLLPVMQVGFYVWLALSFEHPYEGMEGRLTTAPTEVLVNYFSLVSSLVVDYIRPAIHTGFATANPYYPIGIGVFMVLAVAALWMLMRKSGSYRYQYVLFICGVGAAVAIAPLALIRVSHVWHYFFQGALIVMMIGLIAHAINRKLGIAVALVLLAAGAYSNFIQMSPYEKSVDQQEALRRFINENHSAWAADADVNIVGNMIFLSGLGDPARSNAFFKILTNDQPIKNFGIVHTSQKNLATTRDHLASQPKAQLYVWTRGQAMPTRVP